MIYGRIDLKKTNYELGCVNWKILERPNIDALNKIYYKYCKYKKFKSVVPVFDGEYKDPNIDVIGYYHNKKLVAFSLMRHIYKDKKNIEAYQFAWDYENPELKLGLKSLENECALYKSKSLQNKI
jgi:hypothetical protein